MTTPNLELEQVPDNSLRPGAAVNDAFQILDALVQGSVVEAFRDTPPATTAADIGSAYIIGDTPTGAWADHGLQIALCTAPGLWRFLVPKVGWTVYVQSLRLPLVYHTTGWEPHDLVTTFTENAQIVLSTGSVIVLDSATPITLMVRSEIVQNIPVGRSYRVIQVGTGSASIVAGDDAVIRSAGGLTLSAQYSAGVLTKIGKNEWLWAAGGGGGAANADAIGYDNTGSGLTAENVQGAVDELSLAVEAISAGPLLTITTKTANATLALSDGNWLEMDVATANTLTVPPNANAAFPVGVPINVHQRGAGQTTIVAGAGVTIRTPETLKLRKRYATVVLVQRAVDEWVVAGDLEAAP